jgi:hypothetical protein
MMKKLTITLWAHHHFFSLCGPPGTLYQVQEPGNYVAAKLFMTSTKFIAKMNICGVENIAWILQDANF